MKIPNEGVLLRIFIAEADKWSGKPLYEQIILLARKMNLAGATAIKGFMGFGCKSHMHTTKLLRLCEDLPVIVEIVDSKDKIDNFLPHLDEMVAGGLVTLQKANVIMYKAVE